jgi:hypothetical protein
VKELKDMDFNELVDYETWHAMQGIASGDKLRSSIWHACNAALAWSAEKKRVEAEAKRKKK